jgi:uncharacterized RDD family membrane protein YckC
MNLLLSKLLVSLLLIAFLIPLFVGAIEIKNPLKAQTFQDLIKSIIKGLRTLALTLAPLMIIIAGFYFVTAAGNPAQITTAKKIILYTLIGLGIILMAEGIIKFIEMVIEKK